MTLESFDKVLVQNNRKYLARGNMRDKLCLLVVRKIKDNIEDFGRKLESKQGPK